ncbi:MAG: P-loop containing nucleoside triphosphate hydrolase protein [Benniella sp.]|nr:MAG: P-loop containing nucleoside triphosphate hydrolase protein [Benniella sp.]
MKRLIPFMYPKGNTWLQFLIILTGFFLLLGRVVNLLVPIQTKRVVSRLYTDDRKCSNGSILRRTGFFVLGELQHTTQTFGVWGIILYVSLRFIQHVITGLRGWAWIPVEQYSHSTLTIWLLEHVHNLSLQFHLNRKTGELLRIMDRGTGAVMSLLGTLLFRLFPAVADALIAVVYFCVAWNWRYSVIVFTTIVTYVVVTVVVTEWRTKFRRDMVACDNEVRAITVDSLLNYETIKYDAAEEFETERYREAIREFVIADYRSRFSNHLLTLLQSFVITMGTLTGCLLCAYEISIGKSEPANFVAYTVYLNQLYPPINRFGQNYGALQQKLIDMEKMLKLLEQDQTVKDIPGAERLVVQKGEIVFQNVGFHYDSRQRGLQNINFTVPKGGTVALVGSTGSGKSTILRLLFRFYDATSGRILIDGQDISQKTQTSLREQIGVVPQDVVLLNDTIYNNIRHGRPSATEEQVKMAAKAAQIHDTIMAFPDQYDTKVGERALKLSGGEKQRVAIARTILKNPPIVLLDEATSALDPVTESQIQAELTRMTENRTTLVVTHRLSTIVNADLILCIEDGIIVEQGTHSELIGRALANGGKGKGDDGPC